MQVNKPHLPSHVTLLQLSFWTCVKKKKIINKINSTLANKKPHLSSHVSLLQSSFWTYNKKKSNANNHNEIIANEPHLSFYKVIFQQKKIWHFGPVTFIVSFTNAFLSSFYSVFRSKRQWKMNVLTVNQGFCEIRN